MAHLIGEVAPYMSLGMNLTVTVGVCSILGWWLDGQFDTKPIQLMIFSLMGVAIAIYNFLRTIKELDKRKKEKKLDD